MRKKKKLNGFLINQTVNSPSILFCVKIFERSIGKSPTYIGERIWESTNYSLLGGGVSKPHPPPPAQVRSGGLFCAAYSSHQMNQSWHLFQVGV